MTRLLHRIAHFFGWNAGHVETVRRADSRLYVGFRCTGCGALLDVGRVDEDALLEAVEREYRDDGQGFREVDRG